MKTRIRQFAESRLFIPATVILYLVLAGLLFYVIGTRTKGEIEVILTQWISRLLWADFLLIVIGALLCRSDIAAAFRRLFAAAPRPYPLPTGDIKPEIGELSPFSPCGAISGDEERGCPASWRRLNRPGVWLLAILIAGLLLLSQVAPQVHRIYYDEDIYANMGQNIALTGQMGMANYGTFEYGEYFVNWLLYNKDPGGWPFLISLVFQLFGTDETFAFYLNNLLFAGGILVVFFITRLIAGGWFAGLLAALIYALIPHNLIWSNTIAAEGPAAFFGGLAVLCTLVWLRTRETRHLFLVATVLPFACAMRPESALIALWALAAVAVEIGGQLPYFSSTSPGAEEDAAALPRPAPLPPSFRHPLATRTFWAMGLIAFALILPLIWHFYAVSGQSWGAERAKFAIAFFPKNLATNGLYYLNNKAFPVLFTLLAVVGLAAWKGRTGQDGEKTGRMPVWLLLLWFVLFWGIFLFFYAGSYQYGADVRFALVSFMPLAALAGIGGEFLRKIGGQLPYFRSIAADTPAAPPHDPPRDDSQTGGQLPYFPFGIRQEDRLGKDGGAASSFPCEIAGAAAGGWPGMQMTHRWPVAALLILVLVLSWLKFMPLIRLVGQEAWGARYDHAHAREFIKKIPSRAIVLTHVPTMFLLWGQNAVQAYAGVNNPDLVRELMTRYNGHVYFHQSFWCNTLNDANRTICEEIRKRYHLDPVAVAREQTYEYGLYRLTFK